MKKKLILFLSISFIVFIVSLFFYRQKQKNIQIYLKQVETINTDIEKNELSQINLEIDDNKTSDTTGENKEKMIEEMVANQLADIDSLSSLDIENTSKTEKKYQRVYLQQMKKDNYILAIKAIKKILETTKHKDVWYDKIVDLYVKVGDYKNAEEYMKKLLKIQGTKENLHKYLYIKFQNINFFDNSQVKEIKDLVAVLYKKKVITESELTFYNFLINLLTNWDVKNIELILPDLIKNIKDPLKKNLILSIKNDLEIYKNSKGSPLYYFKSLVALDLLKFNYFGLARNIAEQVYIEDSFYILPKQILAYSYFFMGDYKNAVKYFQELKKFDTENNDDYTFFLGVSYFWLKKYENTLLFLDQIKKTYPYYLDALRYKFLAYKNIKDIPNAISTLKNMLGYKLTYIDYYNIFKFLSSDCPFCYKNQTKLYVKLIEKCYKDTDKEHKYVCWYGKADFYNKLGKKILAARYYKMLSKYFQDPYIFDFLAKFYEQKGDKKRARYYYIKELLYTSKDEKREIIKKKIKELLMSK